MNLPPTRQLSIPEAPSSIKKGVPLKHLLDTEAIRCLAHNITQAYPTFDADAFCHTALENIAPLGILERGQHIAKALREHLPAMYQTAIEVLLDSLTPPLTRTESFGLAVFFYLPHVSFVASYGLSAENNGNEDPFEISMRAQYELTRRFSAEFSIRPFLIQAPERTLSQLLAWTKDADPHVRRLCSEGTRPRLPWAIRLPMFIQDPTPVLPILEALKEDKSLYVRRSVANHLGDIAKDHPGLTFEICERWLQNASNEVKWLIRHALRHPAKKAHPIALKLRTAAKATKSY
ncbi:MAG: DNA alkylation repair protein [Methylophilus sp.]|nr:DNA alkylation repair protein [Methylophilus sp.]